MTRVFALDPEEAQAVNANLGPVQFLPPGDEFFSRTVRQPPLRIVLQGWAAEQQILTNGRRQIFRFILPGDVFGFHASPDAAITAISEVRYASLLSISGTASLAGTTARIVEVAAAELVGGLRSHILRLGALPAHARVAHLILELYCRLERVGLVEGRSFEMPLQQDVLADAVGLSTVHTNRVLQKLRGEGLLETRRNLYSLPDLKKLAEIADYGAACQPDPAAPIVLAR